MRDARPDAHRNNLNLIRLALASLVLLSHSFELIDGNRTREPLTALFHSLSFGEFAVDGFFLLSGNLIVGSFVREPDMVRFLVHRILRIFPGFLACALVCTFVVAPLGSAPGLLHHVDWPRLLRHLPALQLQGLPPSFAGMPYPDVNGSLWSLQPEFQCYLLALACGLAGCFRRTWRWLAIGAVLCGLYWLRLDGRSLVVGGMLLAPRGDLCRLAPLFLAGGCTRLFARHIRYTRNGALASLGALLLGLQSRWTAEAGLAVFGSYLLFWAGQTDAAWLRRVRGLPDVSYGTYLYAWPVQKLLLLWLGVIHPLLLFALALPLAWMAGALSWFLVERPALGLRRLRLPARLGRIAASET